METQINNLTQDISDNNEFTNRLNKSLNNNIRVQALPLKIKTIAKYMKQGYKYREINKLMGCSVKDILYRFRKQNKRS